MGKLGGFLQIERHGIPYRDPVERAHDYREFMVTRPDEELREQGARCMDCGVPFCHNGCPLGNLIPDWNDLVYRDRWADAIVQLHATNNFPELTGRLCPAPCEASCVLEIRENDAVTIKQIELAIIDRAWQEGWIVPRPPRHETGQSVAVVGSGPAGMAAAQQLRRAGHRVVLFERDEAAGGLARFGVPDFKIEKRIVQRRVEQLIAEGVELRCGVEVGGGLSGSGAPGPDAGGLSAGGVGPRPGGDGPGGDAGRGGDRAGGRGGGARAHVSAEELRGSFDAVVLATGSRVPRDLPVPGRELDGVHFAMDYLYGRNRWVARELGPAPSVPATAAGSEISARGKDVVVIGGGDTGADCVGNALREGARSILQLELLPEPPAHRPDDRTPWPEWPLKYRMSYAMEEALKEGLGEQDYSIVTTRFSGDGSHDGASRGDASRGDASRGDGSGAGSSRGDGSRGDGSGAGSSRGDGSRGVERVAALHIARAEPAPPFAPVAGTERELPAQLVLLAMGFLHPEQGLLDQLGVERDPRGNVKAVRPYTTSVDGVFAAGDARRGQSLIVWAINEGRQCARMVDRYLAGLRNGATPGRGAAGVVHGSGGGARPEDQGLAGHADADEGPEGPPNHVGPGVPAG